MVVWLSQVWGWFNTGSNSPTNKASWGCYWSSWGKMIIDRNILRYHIQLTVFLSLFKRRFTWISGWGSASPVWWLHVPSSRWGRWGCSSCCWTRRWRRDRRMTGRSASPPEWYPPRRRKHTAPSANHPAPSEPCWCTYGRTGSPYWFHFLVSLRETPSHPLLMRVKKGGEKWKEIHS